LTACSAAARPPEPRINFEEMLKGQAGTSNIRDVHLASDYIHPYKDTEGRSAHCRVQIYLPDDTRDDPVVICSELPNNPGGSITNSAKAIAAGVTRANKLPTPLVWIEHWPEESTDGGAETFELVVFSSYEVAERAPYFGETRAWIGEATWQSLDRATVEVLVGGKV
jgi:hypothetical protein